MNVDFRHPIVTDAASISECIRSSSELSQVTDGSRTGIDDWNDLSGPKEIAERINSKELSLVACQSGQVVGYIAFKRTNHISLLFVRNGFQGKGIGRQLVGQTVHQFSDVTVNSTDLAIPFYEKMGFRVTGERFLKRGAWSTPMAWANKAIQTGHPGGRP